MKKNITVISHFYNEEYLLPWWLKQHSKIFDHGIMIDYHSTDRSVEIINEICPSWEVVKSKNAFFDAEGVDREVMEIETTVEGYKICLNTTEFLVLDNNTISIKDSLDYENKKCYVVKKATMVDTNPEQTITHDQDLITNKNYGIDAHIGWHPNYRFLHNSLHGHYGAGRHNTSLPIIEKELPFMIYWYAFSPWTKETLKRKTQIKNKIPESDKLMRRGYQHQWSVEEMEKKRQELLAHPNLREMC